MTIFFLNLPSSHVIIRRYMCTSFSLGGFLFPPHDLLALAGIAEQANHQVFFTDCVAEKKDLHQVKKLISEIKPDIIISITSFELYEEDMATVKLIKQLYPNIKYGLFGHFPTHFAKETLEHSMADFILLGEPDNIFERMLKEWKNDHMPENILGTTVRTADKRLVFNGEDRRVPNPDLLPTPPYQLLKSSLYSEHFMPPPLGLIQTARGCPYKCNYCVHSFGTKLTVLSPENVVEHILYLKKHNHIESLRFIDDTFTAIPSRVIKICKLMIEKNINLPWTCLSRADTLDEEMLYWMKRAGCVRLSIGMESGSQRILDLLDKGIDVEKSVKNLEIAKKTGLELMGFFLTGVPGETEKDIELSIKLARRFFDYVVVDAIKLYPGTPLFEKMGHLVHFSLVPYQNYFLDPTYNQIGEKRRSRFYREFYFSTNFLRRLPKQYFLKLNHFQAAVLYVMKLVLNRNKSAWM